MADIFSGNQVRIFYNSDTGNNSISPELNTEISNIAAYPSFGFTNEVQSIETYDDQYINRMEGQQSINAIDIVVNYVLTDPTHQYLDKKSDSNDEFQITIFVNEDEERGRVENAMFNGVITNRMIAGGKDEAVTMTYTFTPTELVNMAARALAPALRRGDYGVGANGTTDYPQYEPDKAAGNAFVKISAGSTDNPSTQNLMGIELVDGTVATNSNIMMTTHGTLQLYARNNSTGWVQLPTQAQGDVRYVLKAQNLSDVPDKNAARTNLDVYSKSESTAKFMMGGNNLSELTDVKASRTKLDVYSKGESEGKFLQASKNLNDLVDVPTARTNLDVYSKGEALAAKNNLSEVSDKAAARTNLGVSSTVESDTKYVPKTTKINNHPLNVDIIISKGDVGLGNVSNDAQLKIASNLSDVADKAAARTNLGIKSAIENDAKYVPKTTKVNGHDLSTDVSLTNADVGLGNVTNDKQLKQASNLSDVADKDIARSNINAAQKGVNSDITSLTAINTPVSVGTPVFGSNAATKQYVDNLFSTGTVGPTMNGVMNYGIGDFHLRDSRAYIQPYEITSDGQVLSRADYPELWNYAQMLAPIDDATWVANAEQRGKYSKGNGTTTFRVPDRNGVQAGSVTHLFARGDGGDPNATGICASDSLPNITGEMINRPGVNALGNVFNTYLGNTGSFVGASGNWGSNLNGMAVNAEKITQTSEIIKFDASRSSHTYGHNGSHSVIPRCFTGVWVIRFSGGFTAANTSWSVLNADSTTPTNGTSTTGGSINSVYKVGTKEKHKIELTSSYRMGDTENAPMITNTLFKDDGTVANSKSFKIAGTDTVNYFTQPQRFDGNGDIVNLRRMAESQGLWVAFRDSSTNVRARIGLLGNDAGGTNLHMYAYKEDGSYRNRIASFTENGDIDAQGRLKSRMGGIELTDSVYPVVIFKPLTMTGTQPPATTIGGSTLLECASTGGLNYILRRTDNNQTGQVIVKFPTTTGTIALQGTSGRDFKTNITTADPQSAHARIMSMDLVNFVYKDDEEGRVRFGIIAEDAERTAPQYIKHNQEQYEDVLDQEGNVIDKLYRDRPSVDVNPIVMDLLGSIHVHESTISNLEHENNILNSNITALQNKLNNQENQIKELYAMIEGLNKE